MIYRLLVPAAVLLSTLVATTPASAVTSAELFRSTGEGYGKFEARIRYAVGDGIVSSFFLWKDRSEQPDIYWNELDFEKLGANCRLQTNSIYGLPERNHEAHHRELEGLCDGYHTYTYIWTPDYIAWLVDGVELRRDTGAHAKTYSENATADGLQMRFNVWPGNASFGGNFSESSLPAYQYIDWAQYASYTPGAGDDGSDFTLKWREDFDKKPSEWSTGSWESPLGRSTHHSRNISFIDGIAVLALTAEPTAYAGTPPQDGEVDGDGGASNGMGDEPGMSPSGGAAQGPVLLADRGGCVYGAMPAPLSGGSLIAYVSICLLVFMRRPRRWAARRV